MQIKSRKLSKVLMLIDKFPIYKKTTDPRKRGYLNDAHMLGFPHLHSIHVQHLQFAEGQLSQEELPQLALKLLRDPVTQSPEWTERSAFLVHDHLVKQTEYK